MWQWLPGTSATTVKLTKPGRSKTKSSAWNLQKMASFAFERGAQDTEGVKVMRRTEGNCNATERNVCSGTKAAMAMDNWLSNQFPIKIYRHSKGVATKALFIAQTIWWGQRRNTPYLRRWQHSAKCKSSWEMEEIVFYRWIIGSKSTRKHLHLVQLTWFHACLHTHTLARTCFLCTDDLRSLQNPKKRFEWLLLSVYWLTWMQCSVKG